MYIIYVFTSIFFIIFFSTGYVTYQEHLKGGGWLEKVDSRNSDSGGVNSYAGIYGRVIDAIRMK